MALNLPNWRSKRLFSGPAAFINSSANGSMRKIEFSAPLADGKRSAINRNHLYPSFIVGLSFDISPSAIFRGVIPTRVDSIKGITFRTWSKSLEKTFKAILPFIANSNSFAAIALKVNTLYARASISHVNPRTIFFGVGHAVRCC